MSKYFRECESFEPGAFQYYQDGVTCWLRETTEDDPKRLIYSKCIENDKGQVLLNGKWR